MADLKRASRKKKLGDFPYGSVVFTATIALLILGLLGITLLKSANLRRLIKQNVEVYIYLEKFISSTKIFAASVLLI
jgi:cell division transport system permease protein